MSETRTIEVKLAKASKDDIDRCRKFFQFVEEFMEYGTHTPENEDFEEESNELTDKTFVEKLREMWGGRLVRREGVDTSWNRVVWGCDMLIDNCCDPEADCLELRQDWAKAIQIVEDLRKTFEESIKAVERKDHA